MNPLPCRLLAAAVVSALIASPAVAQERERARARQRQEQSGTTSAPTRQAQPRSQAPQAQAPPASSTREGGSARESARREPARSAGVERSRGSDDQGRARGQQQERAVPRVAVAPPARVERSEPPRDAGREVSASSSSAGEEQRRAQPRGSRPRGDNPVVGRAEPRNGRWYGGDRNDGWRGPSGHRGGYYYGRRVYNNYYYYPRHLYPYGYGAFGLGYFYYNPYSWYGFGGYYGYPGYAGYGGYAPGYYSGSGYYTGELRLRVEPRHAEVYVDGYFAGHVDDFDGTFQALKLEEGGYRVEIVAPGYERLEFDIRIQPGRKITYRGELRPRP